MLIESFLIEPVQRVPRYVMLVEQVGTSTLQQDHFLHGLYEERHCTDFYVKNFCIVDL